MTNAFSLFRSLIIYGICLPLAIFIGYLLATPTDMASFTSVGLLLVMMTIPLFLRWHYPWLILSWNMIGGLYFLPGKPSFSLIMIGVSFFLSTLGYIMNRNAKFISVPSVTKPLLFITAVVCITAYFTGGFGLSTMGSEAVGGKRYIYLLSGVIGYFALVAHRIPEHKVNLYVNMFFGGALTCVIGNLFTVVNPNFNFIFLFFPPDVGAAHTSVDNLTSTSATITRWGGLCVSAVGGLSLLLARYGLRGVLDLRRYWRFLIFILLFTASLFGGFRSKAIELGLTFSILFYLEGLMRSRLLPIMILTGVLLGTVVLPFADKLPLSVQRSLTFLPLNLDEDAEISARSSTDWRLEMWSYVLPQVPQYLILGKGMGIDARDLAMMSSNMTRGNEIAAGAVLAGDYHNGPLSTIIPFGIFGVVGLIWFLVAGFQVLRRNYLYGDPEQACINRFLLTFFLVKAIMFWAIVGSFYSDLVYFAGPIGFSIALNGGVRSPVLESVIQPVFNKFRLVNATR